MKNVVITGVSSGIGYYTCKYLVERGYRVFGSVRTSDDAQRLSQEFGEHFVPLIFDVMDQQAIDQCVLEISDILQDEGLVALINNAGIAVSGPLELINIDDLKLQFDINVIGVVRVTQAFLPFLRASKKDNPKIINLGSISGILTRPFVGPYSASKFALEALTDALRREMQLTDGVRVVLIQAGPIKTPIWQKARHDSNLYTDTAYEWIMSKKSAMIDDAESMALDVGEIVRLIDKIMTNKKPKTRYLVTGRKRLIQLVAYIFPDSWTDRLFKKQLQQLAKA